MRWLALTALLLAACGVRADAPSSATPAPSTPAPTPAATLSSPPSPTMRPNPTAGPGTYTSIALGYRMDLPRGWRRSECQSTRGLAQPPATETFTVASIDDESGTDTGPGQDVVVVHVEDNTTAQSALAWLQSGRLGQSSGTHYEAATIDGRDGARWIANDSGRVLASTIAARSRIYLIWHGPRGEVDPANEPSGSALIASMHILSDAELADARSSLATPSPSPARSAEDVADALARGFAAKDTIVLATVAAPCLATGFRYAGAGFTSTNVALTRMKQAFVDGLSVTVRARPLVDVTPTSATVRATCTSPGKPSHDISLVLGGSVGATWTWGALIYEDIAGC